VRSVPSLNQPLCCPAHEANGAGDALRTVLRFEGIEFHLLLDGALALCQTALVAPWRAIAQVAREADQQH
jgi:hypothetical protein